MTPVNTVEGLRHEVRRNQSILRAGTSTIQTFPSSDCFNFFFYRMF